MHSHEAKAKANTEAKAKANAKAGPLEHRSSPVHVSNRFSLLGETPAEKPVERALVIGDSILRHVKIASPLGAPVAVSCIPGARAPDIREGAHKDCYDTTDWSVLLHPHGEDIKGVTHCVMDYLNFCMDVVVPTKTVCCFPNNKPWITSDVKDILNQKKRAFKDGNWTELKRVQGELKVRLNKLNDYRPVALTSHVMKTMKRLLLNHLRPQVHHAEDPLQFAYREKVGVEDAILYLLHRAHSHLDKGGCAVRVMFFDFSSAFNTIQAL
ncbi:hypothetical protein NFI96_003055 [Prochilodus magdalenae]|nr:hypothetical protein NFI96_003055 [Prochilodus magdalenae]